MSLAAHSWMATEESPERQGAYDNEQTGRQCRMFQEMSYGTVVNVFRARPHGIEYAVDENAGLPARTKEQGTRLG